MLDQLIFPKDSLDAKKLYRLVTQKKLRRIYRGIYSSDMHTAVEVLLQKNYFQVVEHIVPGGILSNRTAFELKPTSVGSEQVLFVTSSYYKTIRMPGLIIKVFKGNNADFLEPVLPNLYRSGLARRYLENLAITTSPTYKEIKNLTRSELERELAKELRLRGEASLNKLRDSARTIAKKLNYESEFTQLQQIISSLLSTNASKDLLQDNFAKAVAKSQSYDLYRMEILEQLYIYLKQCTFKLRQFEFSKIAFKNLSFFEAYFSNYIEGTRFIIDEAEDIVFAEKEIINRHADSHDVIASFQLTNSFDEITRTPTTAEELILILKERHATLLAERPEKQPGKFKDYPNKAGNSLFVLPEDVIGTLTEAFNYYQLCTPGMERALFMMFLITEVHPFNDGNGRIARIMMNAELASCDLFKIMIPTVHRDNYLNGLKLASNQQLFKTYVRVMDQAQAYTASFDWSNYSEARDKIEVDCADQESDQALPIFNRVLKKLELSDLAIQ